MRPPRLKLRTLIVLVTLATLIVGAVVYRQRAARYRALAQTEAQERSAAIDQMRLAEQLAATIRSHAGESASNVVAVWLQKATESKRVADYHERRQRAYLRCARYPWLSPPAEKRAPPSDELGPHGPSIPLDGIRGVKASG